MNCKGDDDVDAKRSRPSIGKPVVGHARKERVLLIGTDQRITSGPAARTAAFRGRIHDCTRIVSRKVRFFSLAPRAPSIHDPQRLRPGSGPHCASPAGHAWRYRPLPLNLTSVLSARMAVSGWAAPLYGR